MHRSYFVPLMVVLLVGALLVSACAAPAPTPAPTPTAPAPALPTPQPGALTVTSARIVYEVVGESQAPGATLSPNGAQIVWYAETGRGKERTSQVCLFTFVNAAKKCIDLPLGQWQGYPYQFQWSPDSTMITLTENPIQLGYDSDIWLIKVADGTVNNLTDDGVVDSWNYAVANGQKPLVDYLPMWNPADGQIYFWRVEPLGDLNFNIGLFRVAPAGGEAVQVRDLTAALPQQLPLFDYERFFMDGVSAMSPDGKTVAALLSGASEMGTSQASLYLIDLQNVDAEPQRIMSFEDFQSAVPEWVALPATPMGLSWTADGKGVVAVANSYGNPQLPVTVFYYATANGFVPVVDFSQVADGEAYYAVPPEGGLPMRVYSPWTGSLSPKGDKLLMLNDLSGSMGLFTAPLPPNGKLPPVSASAPVSTASNIARSSRGSDGKVIMYGLLLNIKE